MKYLLLSIILFAFYNNVVGQIKKDSTNSQSYDYYNNKSKVQRYVGAGLLGGGIILSTTCILIGLNHFLDPTPSGVEAGIFIGLGMEVASVPFLLISDKNRRKAKKLKTAVSMQSGNVLKKLSFQKMYYPAISLKFHF